MRGTIDALPYEVFTMCMAFAVDEQPAGPLEYIMVSKRWERLLLRTPSLWSQIYIQNGEDEWTRIFTFLHLSKKHSLHLDIMTVLPNMDSLHLIARNISRVATILIRPGPSETFTYLYMEQWRRSASYILATLYNNLPPSLVLSDADHSQCPGLNLRGNGHSFYWVIFMQLTMRTSEKHGVVHPVSLKFFDDWTCFRMWEEQIKRCASIAQYYANNESSLLDADKRFIHRLSANQVAGGRTSSINSMAGFASYAQLRDAIRIAIPAFVMLLKEDDADSDSSHTDTETDMNTDDSYTDYSDTDSIDSNFDDSVQVAARSVLDKFADYVELHEALKLALIGQFGHPSTQIGTSIIPAFVKLVHYAKLRGSMILSLPLLLELFDDPNFDSQMSTISRLRKLAEHFNANESLRVTIPRLSDRLRHANAESRQSVVCVLKELVAYGEFGKVLGFAMLPLIELFGHTDPSVRASVLAVVRSLNGYDEFDKALKAIILLLIERCGDKDPGVRTSALSVVQSLSEYSDFRAGLRAAVPSVVERLGDTDPGIRVSNFSIIESLSKYPRLAAVLRIVVSLVIKQLGDKGFGVRTSAASVLQTFATNYDFVLSAAIPLVVERLGDNDPGVRISAVCVLQTYRFDKALRATILSYIERLGDQDPGVRTSAVSAVQGLAKYQGFHKVLGVTIPSVIKLLGDEQPGIRSSAAFILHKLGHCSETKCEARRRPFFQFECDSE